MSEPLEILYAPAEPAEAQVSSATRRRAILALLVACIAWGGSFTWAKTIMSGVNLRAGRPESDFLGVLLLLGWRFLLAGIIWMAIVPKARSGWSVASVMRSLLLGLPFVAAMITQQMGLVRTSEAVNAFLTSLTVLFVPLILAIFTRQLPHGTLWLGVGLAIAGIWLMTGAAPSGFGVGEALGVGCSALFSVHIILINTLLVRDAPARMVGGQFIVTGLAAFAAALLIEPQARHSDILFLIFSPAFRLDLALLITLATLFAFAIMLTYQPRVDPTRAALIYLTEPIFAAAFAWILRGAVLGVRELVGAALIIAANSLVEWLQARRKGVKPEFAAQPGP